ncbi:MULTISPECIES: helix-turn-helix domain-containing protein [Ramlibacter]|uniref:Helix-turn-helix domain-containing protein n=1 Tax=Ramlibacter pinisoli TaxID=2682844 RepID=A0A6N8IT68_9BURK|nr:MULTISPECIES: helix-turn-helix transcriptional regulator [Ramlibacter]MBA2964107.1 helix-turn-helix transcriptional regulator [Ramlibacter sp. CGMCC 1.13660]MVQ29073.1 helix-turn-helix domain-containing protein [Ramlibacter pinisoli]
MSLTAALPHRSGPQPFGAHLRQWRQQRRLSQQGLAEEAEISTRHLSFVETGRAMPSREMVLRLAERLQVPLRERNAMLVAAGYAPMYRERPLGDPAMAPARAAVERILAAHEPWPALAVDRHWNLVAHNRVLPHLLAGIEASLLQPPVNVLRLSLHPQGLAPRIVNLAQWREHLFERLRQQVQATGDGALAALLAELRALPPAAVAPDVRLEGEHLGVALPLQLRLPDGRVLGLLSTTTVFGTAVDVTVQELTLETFFPVDEESAQALRQLAGA